MLLNKKKFFIITTFIFIAAIAVVLFVNYYTGSTSYEFDGTLVQNVMDFQGYL